MELAERTEESADDMTAAEIAPRPKNDTHFGVRYCNTSGSTSLESANVLLSLAKAWGILTSDQSRRKLMQYQNINN